MSKDSDIVTFFKKEPKQTEDGTFYGDPGSPNQPKASQPIKFKWVGGKG